ncbi:MAG: hypothetical protein S4CHLAM102_10830 [Chlamydiia bacterium]|nr:hypothetical protein [Chlamydiia bacterium]
MRRIWQRESEHGSPAYRANTAAIAKEIGEEVAHVKVKEFNRVYGKICKVIEKEKNSLVDFSHYNKAARDEEIKKLYARVNKNHSAVRAVGRFSNGHLRFSCCEKDLGLYETANIVSLIEATQIEEECSVVFIDDYPKKGNSCDKLLVVPIGKECDKPENKHTSRNSVMVMYRISPTLFKPTLNDQSNSQSRFYYIADDFSDGYICPSKIDCRDVPEVPGYVEEGFRHHYLRYASFVKEGKKSSMLYTVIPVGTSGWSFARAMEFNKANALLCTLRYVTYWRTALVAVIVMSIIAIILLTQTEFHFAKASIAITVLLITAGLLIYLQVNPPRESAYRERISDHAHHNKMSS